MTKVKRFKVGDRCILMDHYDRSWHGTTVTIIQVYPDEFMTDYEVSRKLPEGNTAYPERSCFDSQLIDITKKEDNVPPLPEKYDTETKDLLTKARATRDAKLTMLRNLVKQKLKIITSGPYITMQKDLEFIQNSIDIAKHEYNDISKTIIQLSNLY